MSSNFLDLARQGKNGVFRYLFGIVFIFLSLVVGGILTLFLKYSFPDLGNSPLLELFSEGPLYISGLVGIILTVEELHHRRFTTLIGAGKSIRFRSFFAGARVWFLLMAGAFAIDMLLDPKAYTFAFDPKQWFALLVIVLLITPIQTSVEELLLRGYLLQGFGSFTRDKRSLIFLTSFIFMILHFGNPEMLRPGAFWTALDYFTSGVFLAAITLKSNRLELALGVHAANNVFIALFANAPDSAMPTPALFTVKATSGSVWSWLWSLVLYGIFYYWFFGRRNVNI
jgi:uncharacterized protein